MAAWLEEGALGASELDGVFRLRPELYTGYLDLAGRLWGPGVLPPVTLELVRLRIAQLHDVCTEKERRTAPAVDAGLDEAVTARLEFGAGDRAFTETENACLLYAEQFVMAPDSVTDADRKHLHDVLGPAGVTALAFACAVYDGFARFQVILGAHCRDEDRPALPGEPPRVVPAPALDPAAPPGPPEFDPADPIAASPLALQPDLLASFLRLYGELWWGGVVGHKEKEVARLRNARVTGCRYCRNVRFSQARDEGLTEELVTLIDDRFEISGLEERLKVVIRFADRFLGDPHDIPEQLRLDLVAAFGPDGTVELAAGLALFMGFSKIAVTLGTVPEDFPTTVIPTPGHPAA